MYVFGDIVLARASFLEQDAYKVRPLLVISHGVLPNDTYIVCPITSKETGESRYRGILPEDEVTGLRKSSFVRYDRIATLTEENILQKVGRVPEGVLEAHREILTAVLGWSA